MHWCSGRAAKRHQARMEPAAIQLLVEKIGPDLGRLDAELGKLAAAAARPGVPETVITRAVVQEFTGLSREEQAWEIQNPVLAGHADAALAKLDELLRVSRVPEVMVGWSLVDLARKIHDASCLLAQGESEGSVAKALRLWGPSAFALTRAARHVRPAEAAAMFRMAVETDRSTKNGTAPEPARAFGDQHVTLGSERHREGVNQFRDDRVESEVMIDGREYRRRIPFGQRIGRRTRAQHEREERKGRRERSVHERSLGLSGENESAPSDEVQVGSRAGKVASPLAAISPG